MKNIFLRFFLCTSLITILIGFALTMTGCECRHYYDEPVLTKIPTCTEDGEQVSTCIRCYEKKTEVIAKNEKYHNPVETSSVAPTCTEQGIKYYTCSYCNTEFYQDISALGHSYSIISKIDATCTEEGAETSLCATCGKEESTKIPAKGHRSTITALVEPTCKDTGLAAGTRCEVCNETLSGAQTLPTVDHMYENAHCIWCSVAKKYTVTYISDSDAIFPVQTYSHGDVISLPSTDSLENEYSAFLGWFTEDGVQYTATSTVTDDIILYARVDAYVPISDVAGLLAIKNAPNKNYKLTKNIDAEGIIWTPIDSFSGTLNGNGYAIYNIVLSTTESKDFGFIRVNNGTVKNLHFKDFTFNATYTPTDTLYFGVVAAQNNGAISSVHLHSGTAMLSTSRSAAWATYYSSFGMICGVNNIGGVINGCSVKVDAEFSVSAHNPEGNIYYAADHVAHYYFSGIVGQNKASIRDSLYEGSMKLSSATSSTGSYATDHYARISVYFGSVIGENSGGAVERCNANAYLDIKTTSNRGDARTSIYSGILAGKNSNNGVIEFSYAGGEIIATASYLTNVGGFIGFNDSDSSLKSCYSTAYTKAAGGAYLGGFVGSNSGIVQNSYSAGEVILDGNGRTGGFVGSLNASGTISKCYSTGDVACGGGDVGHFLGFAEGAVLKCYFMDSSTVMSAGTYLPIVTEYNTIEGIVYTKLWNEDFLINEMYWEDYGWIVIADENPLLAWEIDANHNFVTTIIEPTCERGGFTVYSCTDCSRLFIKDYKDPTGHKHEVIITLPATCAASGYTLIRCSVESCGHEEKINLTDKLPHAEASLVATYNLAPTCTTPGKSIYYCSDCKNGDIVIEHAPLDHSGIYISTITHASCTSTGEDLYYCSRCGEYTQITDMLPHTPISVDYLAPTCGKHLDGLGGTAYFSEDGHMPGEICSVCDTVLSGCEVIFAHTFTLTDTVTAPDCLNTGIGIYTCTECEYTEEKAIPAKGHTDSDLNNICNICNKFTFTTVPESLFTHIDSVAGLDAIRNNLNGYYILDADIDLTGYKWTPIGTEAQPFKGMLYGAGHTVKGLSLSADEDGTTAVYGLFGYSKGTVSNLKIESLNISVRNSHAIVGGIVAYNMGNVMSCSITGDSVFKLMLELNVTDYTHHTLERIMSVGGIVGINDQTGKVQDCKSEGHVSAVLASKTKVSSSDAKTALMALIYNTKAETRLDVSFGAIVGKNEGIIDGATVAERVSIAMEFSAELVYRKGRINAAFNVYAADIVGYNSGTVTASSGRGSAYNYVDGYSYKNLVDNFFKGKLYEISVTFVNHSENSEYSGLIGGNEGTVII